MDAEFLFCEQENVRKKIYSLFEEETLENHVMKFIYFNCLLKEPTKGWDVRDFLRAFHVFEPAFEDSSGEL